MHSYHSQKLVENFEGLNHGRLRKIRRRTQVRQNSLYEKLSDFESLPESQQIETMQHHVLSCGTNASEKLDAAYFDCLPALEEISDIRQESIISEKSYIDDSYADISNIPDLEVIPEVSNLPSLLGLDYASRDCTHIFRSRTRHSINESSYCHM